MRPISIRRAAALSAAMSAAMPAAMSAAAGLLLLSGCLSVLPEPSTPEALISLPAESAVAPQVGLKSDVAIYPPETSRALVGPDMAVRSGGEIVYLGGLRWSDSAPRLLQGAVLDALAGAPGPGRSVSAQLGAQVDYEVRWRLADLSIGRRLEPALAVADVSLVDARTGSIVAQTRLSASGTPSGPDLHARANALAGAAQALANAVAAFAVRETPLWAAPGAGAVPATGDAVRSPTTPD